MGLTPLSPSCLFFKILEEAERAKLNPLGLGVTREHELTESSSVLVPFLGSPAFTQSTCWASGFLGSLGTREAGRSLGRRTGCQFHLGEARARPLQLLPGVDLLMPDEVRAAPEGLAALAALVGLLPRVGFVVLDERRAVPEGLAALVAGVGLLACVDALVLDER